VPCPTYPGDPSVDPAVRKLRGIDAFAPDALHIATEGPLGLPRAARARKLPFTTAYHTRFPEYVQARFGIPLAWTYRFLRWFHAPSRAVMAPTPVVLKDLENSASRTSCCGRAASISTSSRRRANVLNTARPIFLYVGRVAIEKNVEAFLQLDLPGSKWVVAKAPRWPA
jgi:glycosyltransferase involved in cell wall biosynthesis